MANHETGLYYYRARHYDPKVGRFLQTDPVGPRPEEMNAYVYVMNNPVNQVDPMGLESCSSGGCSQAEVEVCKEDCKKTGGVYSNCYRVDAYVGHFYFCECAGGEGTHPPPPKPPPPSPPTGKQGMFKWCMSKCANIASPTLRRACIAGCVALYLVMR